MKTRTTKLTFLAATCMVAATALTLNAQSTFNLAKNGSFDSSTDSWTHSGVNQWGGYKDGHFLLNGHGNERPTLTQEIELTSGQEYLLTARYKVKDVGGLTTAEAIAKSKDLPFLKVKCAGQEKQFAHVQDTRDWHWLYFKFTASNNDPLVLIGEIDGHDINAMIDDVHLSPVAEEKVHLRAFPIVGAAGKNTNYYIAAQETNQQGLTMEDEKGGAALIVHPVGNGKYIFALEEEGENLRFLCATDENDEFKSLKVKYLSPLNSNEDIPDGAVFNLRDPLYTKPLAKKDQAEFTNRFASLESAKYPGRFLRHFQFKLVVNNESPEERRGPFELYHRDATWTWTPAGKSSAESTPPATAMKMDVNGGSFTFGYSTKEKPGFNEFKNRDTPFAGVARLNQRDGDWFSYAQNTGDTEVVHSGVHYPALDAGSAVLHPGPNAGDKTKARFTASKAGKYKIKVTAQLIAQNPTGAGVTIVGADGKVLGKTRLSEHLLPWNQTFELQLEANQHVTIVVDHGEGEDNNYQRDHVLITAHAWTTNS